MKSKNIKVIFDTNVWISFLIGKKLASMKKFIESEKIKIITTEQLIAELKEVTGREKLRKYFPPKNVLELIDFFEINAVKIKIQPTHFINRDPKDNFLLDLIDFSKADYLVTGDKDLLAHNPFKTAKIISPAEFEIILTKG